MGTQRVYMFDITALRFSNGFYGCRNLHGGKLFIAPRATMVLT